MDGMDGSLGGVKDRAPMVLITFLIFTIEICFNPHFLLKCKKRSNASQNYCENPKLKYSFKTALPPGFEQRPTQLWCSVRGQSNMQVLAKSTDPMSLWLHRSNRACDGDADKDYM